MSNARWSRASSEKRSAGSVHSNEEMSSPTYVLEHLATFSVSAENDLLYPADGMRRLLSMEKTSGIWTQKMLMRLDSNLVLIMDAENREIVEQFPLHLIREPTAFTSSDPKELYNNILIYIVNAEMSKERGHNIPAEMHIFQCVNVRARDVVEDLKVSTQRGQAVIEKSRRIFDPENLDRQLEDRGGNRGSKTRANLDSEQNEESSSSISNDNKYERDVTILNRCFDDIERFIARLQHGAAAFNELEKRRRSRQHSGSSRSRRRDNNNDLGDGMLSMRAKPPPEREFVDILQKFKLSFNLLAKLKTHIHDPNAPELVHFLFTPLALIVDACGAHNAMALPSKVVAPLLTAAAVELLVNCLTSKESELWHSLGETWFVPDEEWNKSFVPNYRPVFMDGWSPAIEINENTGSRNRDTRPPLDDEEDEEPQGNRLLANAADLEARSRSVARGSELSYRTNTSSRFEREQNDWLLELLDAGARAVRVTYPRTGNNEKELSVVRGEVLEVLDDTRKWWKTRNIRGQVGHVPHTIVTEAELFDQETASRRNERFY